MATTIAFIALGISSAYSVFISLLLRAVVNSHIQTTQASLLLAMRARGTEYSTEIELGQLIATDTATTRVALKNLEKAGMLVVEKAAMIRLYTLSNSARNHIESALQ